MFVGGEDPVNCLSVPVVYGPGRDFVTDGDHVALAGSFPGSLYRVVMRGYKYTQGPLFDENGVIPFSFERELIHCACANARPRRDDELGDFLDFEIPIDAPSGEYEITVFPVDENSPTCTDGCPEVACQSAPVTVFVRPAYIASRLSEMHVIGNGEDSDDSPEMSFTFNSYFGSPTERVDGSFSFPVEFAGHYPGGREGSAHLTAADDTIVKPDVPLFIGSESRMDPIECAEECMAAVDPEACMQRCASFEGTYSESFEAAFAAIEADEARWWSDYVDVAAGALLCYGATQAGVDAGCKGSTTLAQSLESMVKDSLGEDDDFLGRRLFTHNRTASALGWGIGSTQGPFTLGGADADRGPVTVNVATRRVGSPRVIGYNVRVKSIRLLMGYEDCSGNGEGVNDVFMEARAQLYRDDRQLRDTSRFPGGSPYWEMKEGDERVFVGGLRIQPETLNSGGVGEDSPVLYVELGVWEKDGEDETNDLIGLHSQTYFVADLISGSTTYEGYDDIVLADGQLARRVVMPRSVVVNGWWGGDCDDCRDIWGGPCIGPLYDRDGDGRNETYDLEKGRVEINYEVEITALKYPRMF